MSHHTSYRAVFCREDGEWVELCTEFPSLSHLAATRVEGKQGVATLVAAVVDDITKSGASLPEAMSRSQLFGQVRHARSRAASSDTGHRGG